MKEDTKNKFLLSWKKRHSRFLRDSRPALRAAPAGPCFSKTGIDKKYYPQYEAEVKRCYAALQKNTPDDEESTEYDNNVKASIDNTNEYISFYVSEIEKGHSHAWSNTYAHHSVWGEDNYWIVQYTLESLEVNDKDKEFEIHVCFIYID